MFSGIEIGTRALRAFQLGMEVTGNNVANVNTPGYTRRRLTLQQTPEHPFAPDLRVGTGVMAQSIQRLRDLLLEQRFNHASAGDSHLRTLTQHMDQIEALVNEPSDGGINQLLTDFFDGLDELASRPDSIPVRQSVQQRATSLANALRSLPYNLAQLDDQITGTINGRIQEVNSLADSLAKLNERIRAAWAGNEPSGDLLDQRDAAITRLSELIGARPQYAPDGTVFVFVGEHTLVQDVEVTPLPTTLDVANRAVVGGGGPIYLSSGEVGGMLQAVNQLRSYRSDVIDLGRTLIEEVNAIHVNGYGLDGGIGRLFFAGTDATDIRLHSDVTAPEAIAASSTGDVGNAGVAQALAALRDTAQANLGGISFNNFYRNLVGRIGEDAKTYKNDAETQKLIKEHLQNLRESVSGVSLDEEAANLLKYQRSYQAAAKIIMTSDEMLQDLLNVV